MKKRKHGTEKKQGRIHGNPVADGWAGAVMLRNGQTDGPTDTARCSRVSATKNKNGGSFVASSVSYWEKIEKHFSIFEFRLGINFFPFSLAAF